jgi:N-acetylglutamate synthase-like GNAT family acetyltransferase
VRVVRIVNMLEHAGGVEEAAAYYHAKWGRPGNLPFFLDAIRHSARGVTGLPRFYLALDDDGRILGCCGLIANDFISRHDLIPWLCGLFVEEQVRGKALGAELMRRVEEDARAAGYREIFLTTDHDGYYERYGWQRIEDGHDPSGAATRIYRKLI